MEIKNIQLIEMSSYSPEEGYRKWYEYQPQYSDETVYINLGEINKNADRTDNT